MADRRDRASRRIAWEAVDGGALRRLIELARAEDLAGVGLSGAAAVSPGDPTTGLLPAGRQGRARVVAREPLVAAGLGVIAPVLRAYGVGCEVRLLAQDGIRVEPGEAVAEVSGPVAALLSAERLLLNFLQRLSGVASATRALVEAIPAGGPRLLDTRKTTPGFRALEKYAVACGGGWNHRYGLFDRILLKDNHLAADTGGLEALVARAKAAWPDLLVEVEVDHCEQLEAVLAGGADVILLDNFPPEALREAVASIAGRALTEASGGIHAGNLPEIAATGVDFVSTGAVTHRSRWVDLGLDWAAG